MQEVMTAVLEVERDEDDDWLALTIVVRYGVHDIFSYNVPTDLLDARECEIISRCNYYMKFYTSITESSIDRFANDFTFTTTVSEGPHTVSVFPVYMIAPLFAQIADILEARQE